MPPRGYKIQKGIMSCANCLFGGYIGNPETQRLCICEIAGDCEDGDYIKISVDPLGICEAYKVDL